jgi:hypothetical protein
MIDPGDTRDSGLGCCFYRCGPGFVRHEEIETIETADAANPIIVGVAEATAVDPEALESGFREQNSAGANGNL